MTLRTRTELIQPKDTVQLTISVTDQMGNYADLDTFPSITIVDPTGLITAGPTSAGVMRRAIGKYQFNYEVGFIGPYGVWMDNWTGYLNGFRIDVSFNFVISNTDQPGLNTDGYYALGDEVGFDYTQEEIFNINKLLKMLRARLNSRGISKRKDANGNTFYKNCDIFTVEMLVTFLAESLSLFNEVPHWTMFTFADSAFISQFANVIVEGAVIWALASQALVERGAEYSISDQGISFTPPSMSELLNSQSSTLLTLHQDKVKFIKNSFKPHPTGLGSFSMNGGNNPAMKNLGLRRQRQIY